MGADVVSWHAKVLEMEPLIVNNKFINPILLPLTLP